MQRIWEGILIVKRINPKFTSLMPPEYGKVILLCRLSFLMSTYGCSLYIVRWIILSPSSVKMNVLASKI
jgi:hypothetical protein